MDMLNVQPVNIAIWTDAGRDDAAAKVTVTAYGDDRLAIAIDTASAPLCWVALRSQIDLPAGARILGDHWERGYGDLEWCGVVPERVLPWYALVHDPRRDETFGYGVETGASAFASWRVDETGVTLVLDVRCGGMGVRLDGRRLEAATVRSLASRSGENAFAFARRFCAALCATPRLPAQPVYGGNDWYHRYGRITAETVRADATLIRDLSPAGDNLPAYVIDDGWFEAVGCNGGPYDRGNAGFPDMPGLASWMAAQGIRPGIWLRPLLTSENVPDTWRMPDSHPLHRETGHHLDPSVPEVIEKVRADIGRLAAWDYRVIKHDFTTYDISGRWGFQMSGEITPGGWTFADRGRTTAEIVHDLYGAIREAAGDAYLIGCNTVGHLGAGLFELQRTGDDTSGRHWERTRKMGVNTLAFRMPQHNLFFASDADCVGLTGAIPWELNRQWLDAVAKSGTPLFVSAAPEAVGAEQRAALKAAFARATLPAPPGEPLDWLETTCPRRWRFGDETAEYDWSAYAGSGFACPG